MHEWGGGDQGITVGRRIWLTGPEGPGGAAQSSCCSIANSVAPARVDTPAFV